MSATIPRMVDEVLHPQPPETPRVSYSSRALQQLKENLPASVVPVLLTVLGALAYQSGLMLFYYYTEGAQVIQQVEHVQKRDLDLGANTLMLKRAILPLPIKQLRLIGEFQAALPSMNPVKREQFAARLRDAIDESSKSLGTLEGYTGVESTLPRNWLNSQIEFQARNLEALQGSLACAEAPLETLAVQLECLKSIRKQNARVERALARTQSAEEAATSSLAMADSERQLRWSEGQHKEIMLFRKTDWAFAGSAICLLAYGMLFSYFLNSQKSRQPIVMSGPPS